jgi:hypothetical protein
MADTPRPAPVPDAVTAPFWEGCARRELRIQECQACRFRWLPGSVVCPRCWSDAVTWTAAAGEGTVVSFAVYHRSYHAAFAPLVPYVVAVVELAEGPRLVSNVVGVPAERVRVGMPVRVEWEPVAEAVLPVFRPTGGSAS